MIDQKTKESFKANDEIDLGTVFNKLFSYIKSFFKGFIKTLFQIIDRIYNNLKLLTILVILGAIGGSLYFFMKKPFYESSMTLSSEYFKGELLENSIHNLNEVCEERNSKVLGSLLQIPALKAQRIKSIKVSPIISNGYQLLLDLYKQDKRYQGKLDSLLLYNDQSNFQLIVEVYDTAALRGLDTVLVNYIRQNQFVRKRIAVDRINLENLQQKLKRESGSLDTLKRNLASSIKSSGDAGRSGTNNVILGEKNVNPIDIYREDLEIYNRRQEIERQLALNAEIEIIEKFIPFGAPKSGSLQVNIIKGSIGGLILAILYVLFLMLRDSLTRLRYSLDEEIV
jgi:hypothetical protein